MKNQIQRRFIKEILSYLSTSAEQLLYVGKPSAITMIPRFLVLLLGSIIFYTILHMVTLVYLDNPVFYLLGMVAFIIFVVLIAVLLILQWLFNFYIVTNKKIIDMQYAPPISHNLSTILLDQVRCTEVDLQKNGLLRELLDIGDVIITFDRPTHKEVFTLSNIRHPEQVSLYLGHALTVLRTEAPIEPFWFRPQQTTNKLQIGEDIYPLVPN